MRPPAQGGSCPEGKGKGTPDGSLGSVGEPPIPALGRDAMGGGPQPRSAPEPRVLTLSLAEVATSALPQGCRHGLCQLRDSPRISPLGPEGPSALEDLEEIKLGLIPLYPVWKSIKLHHSGPVTD